MKTLIYFGKLNVVRICFARNVNMRLIEKLKTHGFKWCIRRIMRELMRPTTFIGQYFKPVTSRIYPIMSRSMNYWRTRRILRRTPVRCLYFFYDFEIEPISYDFVWSLCVANGRREALGLAALHVVFVPGFVKGLRREDPHYEQVVPYDARIWRIHAILLPSIQLLACPCSVTLCSTREEAMLIRAKEANFIYPSQYNVTFPVPTEHELAVAFGSYCLTLHATEQAKTYVLQWLEKHVVQEKKIIVVTLRNYAFTPERNSNLEAWSQFAHTINKEAFFIVFVPDTEQDLQGIPEILKDFCFFHAAAWNINLRAALYELAYLNLGVNTGPMSLCWFNAKCRYITFKTAVKNVSHVPLKMLIEKGFVFGQNPRFAQNCQKWVWEDDNFEIITREFRIMCHTIDQ